MEPIWKTRSEILYVPSSKYMVAEDRQLLKQIAWYVQNKADVLEYPYHFVVEFDQNCLHMMRRRMKKRLLGSLYKLWKQHQIEKDQWLDNQHTIL